MNPILLTDSYKLTHWRQYPPGTTSVYSYFESRGGEFDAVTFFGLQYLISHYLRVPERADVEEADRISAAHFGRAGLFNRKGWLHVVAEHSSGLPLRIRAVPEGTTVPDGNVLFTVENTCPQCFWLTNYVESQLVQVWYPTTVATLSRQTKKVILDALRATGSPEEIDSKLHDFGFRGVSSVESAAIGGGAHLVNFSGSDTLVAIEWLERYYDAQGMPARSVPAAEHSTITAWGPGPGETDAYRHINRTFPTGIVSIVTDSYDTLEACEHIWGGELRDEILARDGCLVIRLDSGDPRATIVKALEILGRAFGSSVNTKGYRVLPPQVRLLWGDGLDLALIRQIIGALDLAGWSLDNIAAFGMGGGLLQRVNRDTCRFALKCSSVTIAGQERPVSKDPVTDRSKRSKAGRLKLVRTEAGYVTVPIAAPGTDQLVTVFEDGRVRRWRFDEIRRRAAEGL